MSITINSEQIGDEEAIDAVNCSAFESMDEAHIVRLARAHDPLFDRRFSVVARDGEEIVGHALFSPARIRLMGRTVAALAVGPVAVATPHQREGIGGRLLGHGHELGRREGFAFAFLYGHPSYYPRHGYRPCFGGAQVTLDPEKLPAPSRKFERRPVRPADIPWLVERQTAEWADVDFGWLWGSALGEWSFPGINAQMWWTVEGRRAAYTVARPGQRQTCELLFADDPGLAREVIATIRPKTMAHHPSGWLVREVLPAEWGEARAKASDAAMAIELEEGVLGPYRQALKAGDRPPGAAQFPLTFLAC